MVSPVVAEKLREDELQNINQRDGWAVGTVVLCVEGNVTRRIEEAYIELFNGAGRAGQFGGVKFLAEHNNEYEESYAYATEKAFNNSSEDEGWYVESFTSPSNPDYGQPAP